jgi:hypothetical protein
MDYPDEYDRFYSEELKDDFPIPALPVGLPQERIDRFYEDRRRYANLLQMTDKWLGELLDEIDRQKRPGLRRPRPKPAGGGRCL